MQRTFRVKGIEDKKEVGNVSVRRLWFFTNNGVFLRWRMMMFSLLFPLLGKPVVCIGLASVTM